MKKVLSMILTVVMLLSLIPTTALAAGESNVSMTISTNAASGSIEEMHVGDTVTVKLAVKDMTVSTFSCGVMFDKTKLECVSIKGADPTYGGAIMIQYEMVIPGMDPMKLPKQLTDVSLPAEANQTGSVGVGFAGSVDAKYFAGEFVEIEFRAIAHGNADIILFEDSGGANGYKSDSIETKTLNILKAPIAAVTVADLAAPVKGAAPDTEVTVTPDALQATVAWTDAAGKAVTGNFAASTVYSVAITLTGVDGDNFAETVTAEGYTVTRNSATEIVLTKTFPATEAKSLTKIKITTNPTKTAYAEGEKFDAAGMVVTATYDDNSTAEVTDYTVSPETMAKGTTEVTVSYGGFFDTVGVTVLPLPVMSDFTINLPEDAIYDGAAKSAAITGKAGMGDITVYYNGKTISPVDAGTYAVTFDVAAGSAYAAVEGLSAGSFEIGQREAALAWNVPAALAYSGSAKTVTASVSNLVSGDSCEVTVKDGTATDVGTYTATATALSNDNYKLPAAATKGYEITKAVYSGEAITGAVTVSSKGTSEKAYALSGLPAGFVDVKYESVTVNTDANDLITSVKVNAEKSGILLTTAEKSDNTSATIKVVVSSKNYENYTAVVTVTAKDVEVPEETWKKAEVAESATYGASNGDLVKLPTEAVVAKDGDGNDLVGEITMVENSADIQNAGTATITLRFTVTQEGDYKGTVIEKTYDIPVAKKTLTLTDGTVAVTKVFDNTTAAGTLTGALGVDGVLPGDSVTVDMTNVEAPAYSGSAVDTYTVTLTGFVLAGDDAKNYTIAESYDFTGAKITKKILTADDFTVTVPTGVTYDGTVKKVTVEAAEGVTGIGDINVLYNGAAEAKNAGTYAITINVAEGTNYEATEEALDLSAELVIAKADIALKDIPAIVLVGDETATIASEATLANAADTATFTYTSADAAVAVTEAGTVSATGNAKTTVTVTANAGDNYNPASKEVTVTAVAQPVESITVDKAFNVTYTIEGNVISVSGQAVNLDKVAISEIKVADLSSKGIVISATPAADNKSVSVTVDGKAYNYDVVLNILKVDAIINAADAADTEVPGVAASLTDETMKAISDAAVAAGAEEVDVVVTATVSVDANGEVSVAASYTVADKAGKDLTPDDNTIKATKTPVTVSVPTTEADGTKLMVKDADGEYEIVTVADRKIAIETADFTKAFDIVEPATITINYTYNKFKDEETTPTSKRYTIADLENGTALPTDEKSGYTFKGWQIGEQVYTALTAELFDPANDEDGIYDATASFKKKSSGGGIAYVISVEDADNGTVKASKKTAGKGETVTVTVKPDKGYELDELTVTDKDGDELKLKSKGDGKYTFTMPKGKVYVEATFEAVEVEVEVSFSDVAETDSYFDAVEWAVAEGITTGYANGTFLPGNTVTRAQAVTFLWRAMGEPEPETTEMPFVDVPVGSYYYDAVLWAVENGITTGMTETTFVPDRTISRAQTITFLWRTAKMEGYDVSVGAETNILSYADAMTIGEYAIPAMQWACGEQIVDSYADGTLRPNEGCSRAQTVTFLYRFLG